MELLNCRITYGEDRGTIKFIGDIPNWPNDKAVGIEWDDLKRGKNNGTLDGIAYFTTMGGQCSGSFVKLKTLKVKMNLGQSILEGLVYKYGDNDYGLLSRNVSNGTVLKDIELRDKEFPVIQMGMKKFESYGFTKLSKIQSDFSKLGVVSLDYLSINDTFELPQISEVLKSLTDLSLNFNLLSDFNGLLKVLGLLPRINKVSLMGNSFCNTKPIDDQIVLANIVDLNLSSCNLKYMPVLTQIIPTSLTNLKKLNLSNNNIDDLSLLSPLIDLTKLTSLNLSFNKLLQIDVDLLKQFPSLTDINLSSNSITLQRHAGQLFNIQKLDLSYNNISEWQEIDMISENLPYLSSFKGVGNPLFAAENKDKEELDLIQLVSRFNKGLKMINGTEIPAKQRTNFELYFINKVKSGSSQFPMPTKGRWVELCQIHGVNSDIHQASRPVDKADENEVVLDIVVSGARTIKFTQLILPSFSVGKLRGKISRRLNNLPSLKLSMKLGPGPSAASSEQLLNDQALLSNWHLATGDCILVETAET